MKLLERYLDNIGLFLPKEQKDDILKELAENILSKIEDKEAELGRPLNEAEQEAILKGYGDPVSVANRYGTDTGGLAFGRQLIGPGLFQLYSKILTINLIIAGAVALVLLVALRWSVPEAFSNFAAQFAIQFAVITAIFIAIQSYLNNHPDQWDLLNSKALTVPVSKPGQRVSRVESVAQIVLLFIFASVLQGMLGASTTMFAPFQPAPIWYQLYWPMLLGLIVGIAQSTISLLRPEWMRFHAAIEVGKEAAVLVMLVFLFVAGEWVGLAHGVEVNGQLQGVLSFINQWVFYGLIVSGVVSVVQLVLKVRWLRRSKAEEG